MHYYDESVNCDFQLDKSFRPSLPNARQNVRHDPPLFWLRALRAAVVETHPHFADFFAIGL
jgi:hypothetical protein